MVTASTTPPAAPAVLPDLVVPTRFCGPARSGNGGWTAGSVAHALDPAHRGAVTVALRMPPPLDTPIAMARTDDGVAASLDGRPVATARPAQSDPVPVAAVDAAAARAAEATFPGLTSHPFPTCVSCGTGREPGDGLRIFPGPVDGAPGTGRAAATWTPTADLADLADEPRPTGRAPSGPRRPSPGRRSTARAPGAPTAVSG